MGIDLEVMNKYRGRIWIKAFLDTSPFPYDSRFNIQLGILVAKSKFVAGMTP